MDSNVVVDVERLPEDFLDEMEGLGGVDMPAFMAAMSEPPAVSIKLNRRKASDPLAVGYGPLEPVSWCESGFYLAERPKFTLNPLLHAGVFYVQDASSMIYETLTRSLMERGLLPARPVVLDLCAAPGGKTTSIINALPDGSTVVANEVMPQRVQILAENLQKWGYPRIMVTGSRASDFNRVPEAFDLVAVDAPCSGEGMMRKDEEARAQWSPRLVTQCAALQREILGHAADALRPGGILIYSTCTFNRTENEENTEWLVNELGFEPVAPGIDPSLGVGTQINSPIPALRFMPHLTRGEGLFVAMLRKPGNKPAPAPERTLAALRKHARVVLDGIEQFTKKGKLEIPASQWTLATDFPRDRFAEYEADRETALSYLRHEAIRLDANVPKGYVVITYKGYPLGLVKNVGSRANNLYPTRWRIRNL